MHQLEFCVDDKTAFYSKCLQAVNCWTNKHMLWKQRNHYAQTLRETETDNMPATGDNFLSRHQRCFHCKQSNRTTKIIIVGYYWQLLLFSSSSENKALLNFCINSYIYLKPCLHICQGNNSPERKKSWFFFDEIARNMSNKCTVINPISPQTSRMKN